MPADRPLGAAARWFLHHCLKELDLALGTVGSRLILRRGAVPDVLRDLIKETGATGVFWNRGYSPGRIKHDRALKIDLQAQRVDACSFKANVLFEPWEIQTKAGGPYKVFTPFWRAARQLPAPDMPLAAPKQIAGPDTWPGTDRLEHWGLLPTAPDWANGFSTMWQPGETGGLANLEYFVDGPMCDYQAARDRPDQRGTSGLSPFLRFGCISPR